MARKYNVEGTKKFLVMALVMLVVGLWAVKDGWFPTDSVLQKHSPVEDANFYLFNKSLAIICLLGSAVCGYIHFVVK